MSPAKRGLLIVLALVLHGIPLFQPGRDPSASSAMVFQVPAKIMPSPTPPLFHEELIDPDTPLPMAHVASLCELPEGSLAAAWYAGSHEGSQDVSIYFATRPLRNQSSWSQPRAIVTRDSAAQELNRYIRKIGNSVLFSDASGKLWLLYVTVSVGGWSGSSLNLKTSTDGGQSWTPSQRLTLSPFFNVSELVKNRPVLLNDGNWLVPIYHELAGKFPELLWLRETPEVTYATKSRISGGRSAIQPALVPLTSNMALAFCRDTSRRKRIWVARTTDTGRHWSTLESLDLPNPDAGLDALRMADGRILLVFNDSNVGRENLRLAFSKDEGQTWTRVATLAEGAGTEFSYPFVIQTRDGDIHLVYTWKRKGIKHLAFNPAWLDAQQHRLPK